MAFRDPLFYGFIIIGLVAWFVPARNVGISWEGLLAKALLEELLFRGVLQETLDRSLFGRRRIIGPLGWANLTVSLCFAGAHLFRQHPLWALLTFFPSLIFGMNWDRYRSVIPGTIVHFTYNFLLFFHRDISTFFLHL